MTHKTKKSAARCQKARPHLVFSFRRDRQPPWATQFSTVRAWRSRITFFYTLSVQTRPGGALTGRGGCRPTRSRHGRVFSRPARPLFPSQFTHTDPTPPRPLSAQGVHHLPPPPPLPPPPRRTLPAVDSCGNLLDVGRVAFDRVSFWQCQLRFSGGGGVRMRGAAAGKRRTGR